MTSKQRLQTTLNHTQPQSLVVDFGATTVTGIHCKIVESLRDYYGLERRPVKIVDSFQMLGELDDELVQVIGIDTIGVSGRTDIFGMDQSVLHRQLTPWGQEVLIAEGIDLKADRNGDIYIYAQGDRAFAPSAVMPEGCYFINAIERQREIDESLIDEQDNLEEYGLISDRDLAYFEEQITYAVSKNRGVVVGLGGAGLGDAAFIPGMGLKQPRGIRSVTEWYMSTVMREEYVHRLFQRQTELAISNYERVWQAVGDKIDVVFTCGTDFGTQDSQFCSPETYDRIWKPYYKQLNDWIHQHTTWKVFKHSCGAILPLLPNIIESGFDIINPVQINAKGMDTQILKSEFGDYITFWGGGVDTQRVLPDFSREQIIEHVISQCEILGSNGGFVFNAVHNIQANTPIENIVAVFDAIKIMRT